MARVLLFHWKEDEALPLVERMRGWGHEVAWRGMRENKEVKISACALLGEAGELGLTRGILE